jgi:deoxyhypusine synthase
MDLSWAKFPIIIAVVLGIGWLGTSGGVNYMHNKFAVEATEDAEQNKLNEAGLTRLASFLLKTFRYEKADEVLSDAINFYPEGKNALWNQYRLAKAKEKQAKYQETIMLLAQLKNMEAFSYDDRIPDTETLQLRIDKLAETHELGQIGQW